MNTQQLNKLLNMKKRLNRHADSLGLSYRCDFNFLEFQENFVHLNIESRNTHKLSFRISDGRFIGEGKSLEHLGYSMSSVYKVILRELRQHSRTIKLHNEANQTNCVVFNGKLVPVENDSIDSFYSTNCIYKLINADGSSSRWYGFNAEYALKNAAPFIQEEPVLIQLESSGLNTMEK